LCRNQTQIFLKTFKQIKREAQKGDLQRVAEIVKMSVSTIKMVVNGERNDHHNIQKVFSDLLESRERLTERESARRIKNAAREERKRMREEQLKRQAA
jgi:hypothetical protein